MARPAYHELENGQVLTPTELVIIECLRQHKSDAYVRGLLGVTQNKLVGLGAVIRGKLAAEIWESIRVAADRLGVPRVDLT